MATIITNYLNVFRTQLLDIISKLPKTFINFDQNRYYRIEIYSVYFSQIFRSIQRNILFYTININDLENILLFFNLFLDDYFQYFQNYFTFMKDSTAVNYCLSITSLMKTLILSLNSYIQNYKSDGSIISITQNNYLNTIILDIKKILIRSDPLEFSHIFSEIKDNNSQASTFNQPPSNILNQLLYVQTFFDEQEPQMYTKKICIYSYRPFSLVRKISDLIPKPIQKVVKLISKFKNFYNLPRLNCNGENLKQYMFVLAEYDNTSDDFNFLKTQKDRIGLLVHVDKWNKNDFKWYIENYIMVNKPFQNKVFIVS